MLGNNIKFKSKVVLFLLFEMVLTRPHENWDFLDCITFSLSPPAMPITAGMRFLIQQTLCKK